MQFNNLILVKVTPFKGTSTPDKNGKMPIMLQCVAGRMPNRQVRSGTVAENAGFILGKTYLAQVRFNGTDLAYGEDYDFLPIDELHGMDIISAQERLGPPEIVVIEKPEGFANTYERKGDAIESLRTKRAKEGLYKPAIQSTSTDHRTADSVKDGTTVTGANDQQRNLKPEDLEKNIDESLRATKKEDSTKLA